ncbi:adenylate kinase isoenzyme 1 isoform X2 [Rhinolophus ferrumequinum]|uniref:adenylate kinase isoenzyme 1 isoform X2 n=1 Tax=Rhinolophus ferrumequinum TaxID=59479 RepID=UPI00140FB14E|nr:adenylate kinase isoenzyme 1 isoform X2 [Rhinolophus ferrumequinum]
MILLNGWDRCPCDVEPSQERSGPERGWGATTPRVVGRMGLFKSKLPKTGRPLRPKEKEMLKSPLIIFVMGGPGCGKGTQCKNMATKYGFCHVGLGQLLRQEAQRGTRRGQKIREIMLRGLLVPTVGRPPDVVMVFDCSMETMVRRALHRGQVEHRGDDCEPAILQRLETHYTLCEPVFTFYQQKNLLRNILAEEAPENIFAKCCSVIESLQRLEGVGG